MSNALAISGVTAVLEYYLNAAYNPGSVLPSVLVSALAPDVVQSTLNNGSGAELQVNLFLHQVTPNPGLRNIGWPSVAADGSTPLTNPPLALDLHYLLTAYASEDFLAEALLGYAVLLLHENPVLLRAQIRTALTPANLPATNPLSPFLGSSGLADQIEMMKVTSATLGREEMAWLWTALKADYRPTFPFQVSVVLIEPQNSVVSGIPVLQRTVTAQPNLLSPLPTISAVSPPNGQPAASLGDVVTVQGSNLTGATGVLLINSLRGIRQSIASLSNVGNTSFQFTVPSPALPPPNDFPAGVYVLSAQVTSGSDVVSTNSLPFAIAPTITSPFPGTLTSGPSVNVTVSCAPDLRVGQQASLLIGGQEAQADAFTSPTNSPSFTFTPLQPTDHKVPVWLRVDGIDSPFIDMTQSPPVFPGPLVKVN